MQKGCRCAGFAQQITGEVIPLLASPQGGVASRPRKYREASADREDGVVFRPLRKENHPVCVCFGCFATFY
jgi:hypothetical protein